MHKAAIVVLSNMETHQDLGRVVNALETVKEFKNDDEVELIFDGAGVETAVRIADPDHDLHRLFSLVEDKISGICQFCARAFDVVEGAQELGLPLSAEYDQHPSLRSRVGDGYQVITF